MMKWTRWIYALTISALLVGCNVPSDTGTLPSEPERAGQSAGDVSRLTALLTEIPTILHPIGGLSASGATVADALFDGPFDSINGGENPVIFESIDVQTEPVTVSLGDTVLDAAEFVVPLTETTRVVPADGEAICGYDGCMATWATLPPGAQLRLLAAAVTFRLRPDLKWANGSPVTASEAALSAEIFGADSVFYPRTAGYRVIDDRTLEWRGVPGYLPAQLADVFPFPVPASQAYGKERQSLYEDAALMRYPLGWGAYRFAAEQPETGILLERNPFYFGAPAAYAEILFVAKGRGEDAFTASIKNTDQDTVTQSGLDFSERIEPLLEEIRDRKLSASIYPTLNRTELIFNFNASDPTLRDAFANEEIRVALTQCVNRPRLIREILYGQSEVPIGAYPSFHAFSLNGEGYVGFNPEAGRMSLTSAFGSGLRLKLTYAEGETQRRMAEFVAESWRDCGVEVSTEGIPLQSVGTLRGGGFDVALVQRAGGSRLPCRDLLSAAILDPAQGVNISGIQSAEVDDLCIAARSSVAFGSAGDFAHVASSILNSKMLTIPLAFEPAFALRTGTVCGMESVIGMRSILWNVERFHPAGAGEDCVQSQWNNIYVGN